jgi:hypothetical protein
MIRRYIIWRNNHAYNERLRHIINPQTSPDVAQASMKVAVLIVNHPGKDITPRILRYGPDGLQRWEDATTARNTPVPGHTKAAPGPHSSLTAARPPVRAM